MANGKFQISKGSYGVDVEWRSEANTAANLSTVTVDVYIRYYSISIGQRKCRCTLGNETKEATVAAISHSASAVKTPAGSFSFEVPHENDGTKTVNLSAGFNFDLTSGNYGYIGWLEAGGDILLDAIPRAAVLTAAGSCIGGKAVFRWKPNSASHTFRLLGAEDAIDEEYAPGTTDEQTHAFELDTSHIGAMTGTPPSVVYPVTLYTLQDGREIGKSEAFFPVTMPPYSLPAVAVRACCRADASGQPDVEGTHLYLEAECYISPYEKDSTRQNRYTVFCAVNGVTVYQGDEPSGNLPGVTLDIAQAYRVQIWAEDPTDRSAVSTVNIPTAAADFHLRRGGKGAAFGCYATRENAVQLAEGWTLYIGEKTLEEYIKSLL